MKNLNKFHVFSNSGEERRRVAEENEKIDKDKAIEDIKLAQVEYKAVQEKEKQKKEDNIKIFIENFETQVQKKQILDKKKEKVAMIEEAIADTYAEARKEMDKLKVRTITKVIFL